MPSACQNSAIASAAVKKEEEEEEEEFHQHWHFARACRQMLVRECEKRHITFAIQAEFVAIDDYLSSA
jgi:hypothetical protein